MKLTYFELAFEATLPQEAESDEGESPVESDSESLDLDHVWEKRNFDDLYRMTPQSDRTDLPATSSSCGDQSCDDDVGITVSSAVSEFEQSDVELNRTHPVMHQPIVMLVPLVMHQPLLLIPVGMHQALVSRSHPTIQTPFSQATLTFQLLIHRHSSLL